MLFAVGINGIPMPVFFRLFCAILFWGLSFLINGRSGRREEGLFGSHIFNGNARI